MPVRELDEFDFHQTIPQTNGVTLVFFSGPHCSSCHHLRDLLNREEAQFKQHFSEFQSFEIKADKAAALVNEFSVFHLPSLYLYKDGQFHAEIQAQASLDHIIKAIDKALDEPAEEEP